MHVISGPAGGGMGVAEVNKGIRPVVAMSARGDHGPPVGVHAKPALSGFMVYTIGKRCAGGKRDLKYR
jgi:hypothetical protein